MYKLKKPFQDTEAPEELTTAAAFGPHRGQGEPYYWDTNQYGAALIFLYRLAHSPACRTAEASRAELFFVPLLAAAKNAGQWGAACLRIAGQHEALRRMLPHLTAETAARHFIVVSKGFYALSRCTGFWRDPVGLFQNVARLSVQVLYTPEQLASLPRRVRRACLFRAEQANQTVFMFRGLKKLQTVPEGSYPRHYTIAYPSSIHWQRSFVGQLTQPWSTDERRSVLASFIGSAAHGDRPARKRIVKLCAAARRGGELRCESWAFPRSLNLKRQSIFCLEPTGDSIGRKSVMDSYTCGCIPVFLGCAQAFQYPAFWEGWYTSAFVTVDRERFVSGELDLLETLRQIPAERVAQMQRQISKYASRFQYSLEEVPGVEDAMSTILRRLWLDAEQLSRPPLGS